MTLPLRTLHFRAHPYLPAACSQAAEAHIPANIMIESLLRRLTSQAAHAQVAGLDWRGQQ